MCGRYRLEDNPVIRALLQSVGIRINPMYRDDIAPATPISIIRQKADREMVTATWWLFLDAITLKPTRYTSFNSRSDKLNEKRGISYLPYRQSRCIIPATAFIEGLGDSKTYHMVELVDDAIAFGGLYKEWVNKETGEVVNSASIITLGGCKQWENIHPDSMPLMLDYRNKALVDRWLDLGFSDINYFEPLLISYVRQKQRVTPIGKVSKWNPIGESFCFEPATF